MERTQHSGGLTTVHSHPQPPAYAPGVTTTASAVAASNAKKRPIEEINLLQNSPYYKMRVIVKDLRPHFMEVLRTPDFRNCKGAEEIHEKMKIFMTLYKEMMSETTDIAASKNLQQDMTKKLSTGSTFQNQQAVELGGGGGGDRLEGTYVVGGSAFGWNYVTFPGAKSVYYGRTKEAFRASFSVTVDASINASIKSE